MIQDSPFAGHTTAQPMKPGRTVNGNFCDRCFHVWKAPAPAIKCINCKELGGTVRSLVEYQTRVPIA